MITSPNPISGTNSGRLLCAGLRLLQNRQQPPELLAQRHQLCGLHVKPAQQLLWYARGPGLEFTASIGQGYAHHPLVIPPASTQQQFAFFEPLEQWRQGSRRSEERRVGKECRSRWGT